MARFPFEEDGRHRFGEFHREWTGRYIFIGRFACEGPLPRRAPDHQGTDPPARPRPMTIRRASVSRDLAFATADLGAALCKPSNQE
jgi:hypothetical protein